MRTRYEPERLVIYPDDPAWKEILWPEWSDLRTLWRAFRNNPLDVVLCPQLKWGCRFLRVDHRTLVDRPRDEKALGVLRMSISELEAARGDDPGHTVLAEQKAMAERAKAMAAIEGAFLRNRSLRFAVLDESRLYAADLIEADLRNAKLTEAEGASLSGSNLTVRQLESASRDLRLVDLRGLELVGAKLQGADLTNAFLSNADLSNADLHFAFLDSAKLSAANLRGAKLSTADLHGADLSGADLSGANISGADLSANLRGANLSGAHLDGADLSHARKLTQTQLDQACGTDVKLPEGFTLKPCPAPEVAPPRNQEVSAQDRNDTRCAK